MTKPPGWKHGNTTHVFSGGELRMNNDLIRTETLKECLAIAHAHTADGAEIEKEIAELLFRMEGTKK
jgi:hypothetical protein